MSILISFKPVDRLLLIIGTLSEVTNNDGVMPKEIAEVVASLQATTKKLNSYVTARPKPLKDVINKDKEYTTVDGRLVRIYAVDGDWSYPVHGATLSEDGWESTSWTALGMHWKNNKVKSENDLMKVKK